LRLDDHRQHQVAKRTLLVLHTQLDQPALAVGELRRGADFALLRNLAAVGQSERRILVLLFSLLFDEVAGRRERRLRVRLLVERQDHGKGVLAVVFLLLVFAGEIKVGAVVLLERRKLLPHALGRLERDRQLIAGERLELDRLLAPADALVHECQDVRLLPLGDFLPDSVGGRGNEINPVAQAALAQQVTLAAANRRLQLPLEDDALSRLARQLDLLHLVPQLEAVVEDILEPLLGGGNQLRVPRPATVIPHDNPQPRFRIFPLQRDYRVEPLAQIRLVVPRFVADRQANDLLLLGAAADVALDHSGWGRLLFCSPAVVGVDAFASRKD